MRGAESARMNPPPERLLPPRRYHLGATAARWTSRPWIDRRRLRHRLPDWRIRRTASPPYRTTRTPTSCAGRLGATSTVADRRFRIRDRLLRTGNRHHRRHHYHRNHHHHRNFQLRLLLTTEVSSRNRGNFMPPKMRQVPTTSESPKFPDLGPG